MVMQILGRLAYLALGAALMLAAVSAHAQPVTREEFAKLQGDFARLRNYTYMELALGMLRMDERRKNLEALGIQLQARDLSLEEQVELQRRYVNEFRDWVYNLNNCYNGLVSILSNAGVPQYIADPAQRKSCVDPTQPAPDLAPPMPTWR